MWPFVSRKKIYALEKAFFAQLEISKYWQGKYSEAIQSQDVLNAMLKEATSYEKTTKHAIIGDDSNRVPTNGNTKP